MKLTKSSKYKIESQQKSDIFVDQMPSLDLYPLPHMEAGKSFWLGRLNRSKILVLSILLHLIVFIPMVTGVNFYQAPSPTEIEVIFDSSILPGSVPGDSVESNPSVNVAALPEKVEKIENPDTPPIQVPVVQEPAEIKAVDPEQPQSENKPETPQEEKVDLSRKESKTQQIKVLDNNYEEDVNPEEATQNSIASIAAGARAISAKKIVSPAWQKSLGVWLQEHRKYPESSIQKGEQGTAVVEFIVNRLGYVSNVKLIRGTGYPALDAATMKMLKNARVPAFSPEMTQEQVSVPIQIQYLLEN